VRVALVNPPFGPGGMPSLGLALLSAALKAQGHQCRTLYWDLELVAELPGVDARARFAAYRQLTGRPWFPFNEWAFSRVLYDEGLDGQEAQTRRGLEAHTRRQPHTRELSEAVLHLRDRADALVEAAVARLSGYDVVGIGTTFLQNVPALALARRLKARAPETIVVLGGANCDGEMGPALVEQFPFLDHAVAGEADVTFPELVRRLAAGESPEGTPGVVSREGGGIRCGPPAASIGTLDALPLPDFDDYVEQRRAAGLEPLDLILTLESSRGCWWGETQHCTFCGLNDTGMTHRRKSRERFAWELETIVERYRPRFLYMTDNILPTEYYDGFMDWAAGSNLGVDYFYEIKSNVRRRQVAALSRARVSSVQPGIESFSSRVLSLMRKGVTAIHNVAFLRLAREYGILPTYSILVGFPGEEESEYARVAAEIPKLSHLRPPAAIAEVEFHRFSPYHQEPGAFGLRLRPWSQYAHLYPFAPEVVTRLAYVFEADGRRPLDYAVPMAEEIRRWGAMYDEESCTLTWSRVDGQMTVRDRRPGFGPRDYRLEGLAGEMIELLDEPRGLRALRAAVAGREAGAEGSPPEPVVIEADGVSRIGFGLEAFLRDPEACLRPLVEAALVLEEGPLLAGQARSIEGRTYLALPVPDSFRPIEMDWFS
jgi:ribosomal peptide maturation radical SAM protein 1